MTDARTHRVDQHVKFLMPMLREGDMWVYTISSTGLSIPMTQEAWAKIDEINGDQATITIHSCVMVDNGTWGFQAVEPVQDTVPLAWLAEHTYISQEPLDVEEPLREADRLERAQPILFGGVDESAAEAIRAFAQEPETVDRRIVVDGLHYDVRLPNWMTDEQAAQTIASVLAAQPNAFGSVEEDDQPDKEVDFELNTNTGSAESTVGEGELFSAGPDLDDDHDA